MLAAARRSLLSHSTRAFSTTRVSASDVAKLILVGRLGRDPEVRTSRNDKEYVAYTVATTNYPPPQPNPDGTRPPSETSWHNIYSFSPTSNAYLRTLTRGTHVYVEANYEIREVDAVEEDGKRTKQVFLRHENIRILARPPQAKQDEQHQD